MATEIFYADLAVGPGERCGKRRSLPEPAVLHVQPESPGSGKIGNGNIEDINSTRENELLDVRGVLRELREVLCPSQSPGPEGCRICPQGWTMNGTECYWVSTEQGSWSKSREDCRDRGATLLLPRDRDELESWMKPCRNPGATSGSGSGCPRSARAGRG